MRIPEIKLIAHPETDEAKAALEFKWAPDEIGKRHKLGGEPDLLQVDDVPACTDCPSR